MSFYFGDADFRVGDKVNVRTYDNKEYTGKITEIGVYDDHFHSTPVMSLYIKTSNDCVEIEDWKIVGMSFISKPRKIRTVRELFDDYDGYYIPEDFDWGEDVGMEIIED